MDAIKNRVYVSKKAYVVHIHFIVIANRSTKTNYFINIHTLHLRRKAYNIDSMAVRNYANRLGRA
ncbi:MAG: hypothetical protein N838_34545 [Thiohalocapsa sp. PB-PSB1]|nr:MAG: hypothetical protein N838_34545 [Thiohalocapsa sp. PB-PSB1]